MAGIDRVRDAWSALWGRQRFHDMKERKGHVSWVSLLLMVVQSVTLALVAGHVEISWLLSGQLFRQIVALVVAFILITVVIAADWCFVRSLSRMPILQRNHSDGLYWEHLVYVAFVIGVEMLTLGIALFTIEQNPALIVSSQPLLPQTWWAIGAMVGLRVLLVGWTTIQANIVAQDLPPQWETSMAIGVERIGGLAMHLLDTLDLHSTEIGDVINALAEVSKPAPRRQTWWNRGAIARERQHEQEMDARRARVIEAFNQLSGARDRQREAELEAVTQARIAAAEAQIAEAQREAREALLMAVMHFATTGKLPDALVERMPELAGIEMTTRPTTARTTRVVAAEKEPRTTAEKIEKFLALLGVTPVPMPVEGDRKRRVVWMRSTDVGRLTAGDMRQESVRELVSKAGDGKRAGLAYIAPVQRVMEELFARHLLSEEARSQWQTLGLPLQNPVLMLPRSGSATPGGERDEDDAIAAHPAAAAND